MAAFCNRCKMAVRLMAGKITALKVQKRNPNRVNIYLDGQFAFGLARIVAAWLSLDQELDDKKIAELQAQDTQEVAYQKSLTLIGYRPRAEAEVSRRLREGGFEEPVIEATLDRLRKAGLVEDAAFARIWVENRSAFRPRGRRALAMELRQKGVEEEEISQALDAAADEDQLALEAARRQARRLEKLDWETFRKKLSGFLGRRGFAYGTIAPVIQQIWREMHAEELTENTKGEGL